MTLALPPALFRFVVERNLNWLDVDVDLLVCRSAVSTEQLVVAVASELSMSEIQRAVDMLESSRSEKRADAVHAILKFVSGIRVQHDMPELPFADGLRDRCQWLVSRCGILRPLLAEVICASRACLDAIAVHASTMLTAAPSVRRLACGITLLLWILAIHQHDRSFCVGFARYLSSESNWTILICLVSIVEAVSTSPQACLPIRPTLLLVRLVLRIGLLGGSASERAAQCDDGFPGPLKCSAYSDADASAGSGISSSVASPSLFGALTDKASEPASLSEGQKPTHEAQMSLFSALSTGAANPDASSSLERLLVGILVLLLA